MSDLNLPKALLDRLARDYADLTPEAQKAARHILENPRDVGVSTVRELAEAAGVKPNTLVRMARQLDFEGYEDFRTPFREAIRKGGADFPDRVRWLQDMRQQGALGGLYGDMVSATLRNVEATFAGIDEADLRAAAEAIWGARSVFTLGVGINNANARNFTYLASTGMVQFHAIPRAGSTAVDDLAWADGRDVLIAITSEPYRREVIEAVAIAKVQGVRVIALSDSPVSPIMAEADHRFITHVETPQFFPSSVSILAVLEVLLSFVIATSSPEIVARVETFHRRRHELGLYQSED